MKDIFLYEFQRVNGFKTNFFHVIELAKRIDTENLPRRKRLNTIKKRVKTKNFLFFLNIILNPIRKI